jgi:hypothetical protein
MALITCPDCGREVSTEAVACPNCGRPMMPPAVEPIPPREVIIQKIPEEKNFPAWLTALIIIIAAVTVFALYAFLRGSGEDEANRNVNVRISERETANARSARDRDGSTSAANVPQSSAPSELNARSAQDANADAAPNPPTVSSAPPTETAKIGRSALSIAAAVRNAEGRQIPVQKENFYLLDEDLESILRDADIEDEEGRGLANAFAMSVLYPERYPETNRKALAEINKHVVARTITDSQGKAKFPEVKTDRYYLFGITKTRDGFSLWNTPVTLNEGENILNLEPGGSMR